MNCWKCGEPFALGWWCNKCRWDKDKAAIMKRHEDYWNKPDYTHYVFIGFAIAVCLLLACMARFG